MGFIGMLYCVPRHWCIRIWNIPRLSYWKDSCRLCVRSALDGWWWFVKSWVRDFRSLFCETIYRDSRVGTGGQVWLGPSVFRFQLSAVIMNVDSILSSLPCSFESENVQRALWVVAPNLKWPEIVSSYVMHHSQWFQYSEHPRPEWLFPKSTLFVLCSK